MIKTYKNFAVYGGGSWGTALACQVARVHGKATLFLRDKEAMAEINQYHQSSKYLVDVALPSGVIATDDVADIVNYEVIILATPSVAFAEVIGQLKASGLSPETILLIATKGLANNPAQLLSQQISEMIPNEFAFIAGPNFAKEVALGKLTAVNIAATNIELATSLAHSISSQNFVATQVDDIVTIQIAGALKNIIAIKSGIYKALGYGENARAYLITQGLQEIQTLSGALGGKAESLLQPAVIGDLVLTCCSDTSRNTKFGYELAMQRADRNLLYKNGATQEDKLVEGVKSLYLVLELAKRIGVSLPTVQSVLDFLTSARV